MRQNLLEGDNIAAEAKREVFEEDDFAGFPLRSGEEYGDGSKMTYQFPKLPKDCEEMLPDYNLKVVARVVKSNEYNTKGDIVVAGYESDLEAFADEVLGGYQLSMDYLVPLDSFDFEDLEAEGIIEVPGQVSEDTVKKGGKWVNKGKGGTHGEFKTKKAADAQRKAMFANGYKGLNEEGGKKVFKVTMTGTSRKDEAELGIKGLRVTYNISAGNEKEARAIARKFDSGKRVVGVEELKESKKIQ